MDIGKHPRRVNSKLTTPKLTSRQKGDVHDRSTRAPHTDMTKSAIFTIQQRSTVLSLSYLVRICCTQRALFQFVSSTGKWQCVQQCGPWASCTPAACYLPQHGSAVPTTTSSSPPWVNNSQVCPPQINIFEMCLMWNFGDYWLSKL